MARTLAMLTFLLELEQNDGHIFEIDIVLL